MNGPYVIINFGGFVDLERMGGEGAIISTQNFLLAK